MDPLRGAPPVCPEPFGDMEMFTCTYGALLGNMKGSFEELTHVLGRLVAAGNGPVVALNSNFGHYCRRGHEIRLKRPQPPRPPPRRGGPAPASARRRKVQGDGTCFNSALQLTIVPDLDDPDIPDTARPGLERKKDKYYAVKSFPSTGQTQVSGVICEDFTDGSYIVRVWARFFEAAGAGHDPGAPVPVLSEGPIMVNTKFKLRCSGPNIVVDLQELGDYLLGAKERAAADDPPSPYPIREIKLPQDCQNLSFKFEYPLPGRDPHKIRVNFFFGGKVNILGALNHESIRKIYDYLSALILSRWDKFVCYRPVPDADLYAEEKDAEEKDAAPGPRLTDAEVDEILAPVLEEMGAGRQDGHRTPRESR